MKVLLIGPYPPPLGGVSVFIKRYKNKLESEGHTVDVLDLCKLTRLHGFIELCLLPFKRYDIINVNIFSFNIFMVLFILGLTRKVQVIDHSGRQLENWNRIKIFLFDAFIRRCKELIFIGPHLIDYYSQHGIMLPDRTDILSPFILPPVEEETAILKTYSVDVFAFVERKRPLIIANAYQLVFYKGVDLYGLDMLVELVINLRKEFPNIGLLFALAEIGDRKYYEEINKKIDILGVKENFYFLTGQKELWPLFKRADLMIRPTYSDGYGISIAEALYFKCPAVASDVCIRPQGTTLFKNRDVKDLLDKVREVLHVSIG